MERRSTCSNFWMVLVGLKLCCESGGKLGAIQSAAQYNVLKSQNLATRAICKGNSCLICIHMNVCVE